MKADTETYTDKKADHMVRRYAHHGSIRKLADEFEMSKSQAHRIVKSHEKDNSAN